jgi:glucose/mannose-6-phosphate isomerase
MNLDNPEEFKKYDTAGVLDTVRLLADQLQHGWDEVNRIELHEDLSNTKRIVLAGMGGSALGARVVKSLFKDKLRASIDIINGYTLPHYVSEDTLVILSSYSGNTEEVNYCADHALKLNAKIVGMTTGGDLLKFLDDNGFSKFVIEPKFNPSGQPRLALGYSIIGIIGLLNKLSFITVSEEEVNGLISSTRKFLNEFTQDVPESDNLAKKFARDLHNYYPVLVASEHLYGAAYCFKNQLNESAKTFASLFELPELNHHLMEGLKNPAKLRDVMKFMMFDSELYFDRTKKRYKITKHVIEENGYECMEYFLRSETKLDQAFELLAFGGFVQFYLAMLYELDPSKIPWVDYFKEKLNEV